MILNSLYLAQGDSGGPLVVRASEERWVQVGIVSLGLECARMSVYLDWNAGNTDLTDRLCGTEIHNFLTYVVILRKKKTVFFLLVTSRGDCCIYI